MVLTDVPRFLTWLWQGREKNLLRPEMLEYPTLEVRVSVKGEKPNQRQIAYQPFHNVIMLDSLALDPEAEAKEKFDSVVALVESIEQDAYKAGIREICFVSSDERTDELAEKRLGYTKKTIYRKLL